MIRNEIPDRRQFLRWIAVGSVAGTFLNVRGAFAEELVRTPPQTAGPYYPTQLPLDQDNDLLIINDNITPAVGDIIENRPPLSRWHPDYKDKFAEYLKR